MDMLSEKVLSVKLLALLLTFPSISRILQDILHRSMVEVNCIIFDMFNLKDRPSFCSSVWRLNIDSEG